MSWFKYENKNPHKIVQLSYNVCMVQSRTAGRVVTREVIKIIGFAGAVGMAMVAPNATVLIDTYMKRLDKKNARRTLDYLKYHKLVEVRVENGQNQYRLTTKGVDRYQKIQIDELRIVTPKKWDKKWRLVVFDIPQIHQKQRHRLLHALRVLNFYMLQQSVWIHPFECEKEVGVLLNYLKLEKNVSFMVVERANFTAHAESHFKKMKVLI